MEHGKHMMPEKEMRKNMPKHSGKGRRAKLALQLSKKKK